MNSQLIFCFLSFILGYHVCELKDISSIDWKAISNNEEAVKLLEYQTLLAISNLNSILTSATERATEKYQNRKVKPIAESNKNESKSIAVKKPTEASLRVVLFKYFIDYFRNTTLPKLIQNLTNYMAIHLFLKLLFEHYDL